MIRLLWLACSLIDRLLGLTLSGVPVLLYHSISAADSPLAVSSSAFEAQMAFLKRRGYASIAPDALLGAKERSVLITFDDGFKDNYTEALPILARHGFTATIFIATGYIGKKSSYARRTEDRNFEMLSAEDIRALAGAGWSIANHGLSHTNFPELSREEVTGELTEASRTLTEITGERDAAHIAAYPRNRYTPLVLEAALAAGVTLAFNGGDRVASSKDDPLALPRIEVRHSMSLARFKLIFSPTFNFLRRLRFS